MRDIQHQAEKEARAETDPKSVVPQEYHDFLNVSQRKTQTLSLHIENMMKRFI